MFSSGISILLFATFMLISISAIPASSVNQMDSGIDTTELQEIARRSNEFPSWVYKRNPALCDYRLQFRPHPLTAALCGYGLFTIRYATTDLNFFRA